MVAEDEINADWLLTREPIRPDWLVASPKTRAAPIRGGSICGIEFNWSGRWGSNPRQLAWKASALPLSYTRAKAIIAQANAAFQPASLSCQ